MTCTEKKTITRVFPFHSFALPLLAAALVWGVILNASPVRSQEFLAGQVVAVDRERGEFVLQVSETPGEEEEGTAADRDGRGLGATEPLPEKGAMVTVSMVSDAARQDLPGCLQPGKRVRVWGRYVEGQEASFVAEAVRGGGPMRGEDRSGVRSRLHRCRGEGANCPTGCRNSTDAKEGRSLPQPP